MRRRMVVFLAIVGTVALIVSVAEFAVSAPPGIGAAFAFGHAIDAAILMAMCFAAASGLHTLKTISACLGRPAPTPTAPRANANPWHLA